MAKRMRFYDVIVETDNAIIYKGVIEGVSAYPLILVGLPSFTAHRPKINKQIDKNKTVR